jgi:hypothetical protein
MADAPSLRAFAARQPIENGIVRFDGAPAIEGFWQLDATPLFSRMSGAFAGYRGRLRRPARGFGPNRQRRTGPTHTAAAHP